MSGHIIIWRQSVADIEVIEVALARHHAAGDSGWLGEALARMDRLRTAGQLRPDDAAAPGAGEGRASSDAFRETEALVRSSEERLKEARLRDPVAAGPGAPSAERGYLGLEPAGRSARAAGAFLDGLRELLEEAPAELRRAKGSPYESLVAQVERARALAAEGAAPEGIEQLGRMVRLTLEAFSAELTAREAAGEALARRLEELVASAASCRSLAPPPLDGALHSLQDQMQEMTGRPLTAGVIELFERRLAVLWDEVRTQVQEGAYQAAVSEAIVQNLVDMGYEALGGVVPAASGRMLEAALRVPGGERVDVAVHANGQIGFEFVHECYNRAGGPVVAEDLARLRRQEGRWCADFRELLRRLVAEGFDYAIRMERLIPADAVKVVAVERPEDLLDDTDDGGTLDRRYLD